MKIELLSDVQSDLLNGYYFYENQQVGLGDYFYDSLFADIDSLILFAGIHKQISGFYQKLATKFPFAIYYKITGETVQVYAVLDARKNPTWIDLRLGQ